MPNVRSLRPVPSTQSATTDRAPVVAGDRPLVYLTFGTVFNDTGLFASAMAGIARLDIDVLVTVDGSRSGGAGPVPRTSGWSEHIPHTAVLPHCAAVVSRAGSGTFWLRSAWAFRNCACRRAPTSSSTPDRAQPPAPPSLSPQAVSADAIGGTVGRLLVEPGFRSATGRVRTEIEGMPSPDDSGSRSLEGLP
ncbi:MAG: hypothetical protein WKG07_46100 [Hymenobacter sp.]